MAVETLNTKDPSVTFCEGLPHVQFNHPVETLQLIETHISCIILTGDYAYKVKKNVDLGFVDYSTLEISSFDFNDAHADARMLLMTHDQEFSFSIDCKPRTTTKAIKSAISHD